MTAEPIKPGFGDKISSSRGGQETKQRHELRERLLRIRERGNRGLTQKAPMALRALVNQVEYLAKHTRKAPWEEVSLAAEALRIVYDTVRENYPLDDEEIGGYAGDLIWYIGWHGVYPLMRYTRLRMSPRSKHKDDEICADDLKYAAKAFKRVAPILADMRKMEMPGESTGTEKQTATARLRSVV
jgi:hypothetical protein